MCQEMWSCARACRGSWRNHKMEGACKKGVGFSRWEIQWLSEIHSISYWPVLQCSILVSKIWRAVSRPVIVTATEDSACGAWQQKRGVTQMTTYCLEFLAFGGYYGIANKLVYFNCSGMYAFPVPTYPWLFLAHQKSCRLFFFLPLNTNSMKKNYFLDIKENEVKMTKHRKSNRNLNIGLFYAI